MAKPKRRAKIYIDEKLCKGCEICVAFCPPEVLAMEGPLAVVVNEEGCTLCMLCELRCPDFAIVVEEVPREEAGSLAA